MKKWLLALVLTLPLAFSLEITPAVYPQSALPGQNVAVVLNIVGNADGVQVKVDDRFFDPYGVWMDVGDVRGSAQYVFYIHIPREANVGIYHVLLKVRYSEGNSSVEEYHVVTLRVVSGGLSVDVGGSFKPLALSRAIVHLENRGVPLHNVYVYLKPSLDPPKYAGTLGSKSLEFNVLPTCKNGLESFEITVVSEEGEYNYWKSVPCTALRPLDVRTDLPNVLEPGMKEVNVFVVNSTDVPKTVTVEMKSNVEMAGSKVSVISLNPRSSQRLSILLRVPEDKDSVQLNVVVHDGNIPYSWAFSSVVEQKPHIIAYLRKVERGKAEVGIANVGEGEARNVVVYWAGGTYFIGSLTSGDYDTVEVPLEGNFLNLKVHYSYLGQEEEKSFTLEVPREEKKASPWIWIGAVVLLVLLWWVRRRVGTGTPGREEP